MPQTQLALRAQTELALHLKENYGMDKIYYITCVFTGGVLQDALQR